jgi:Mrp family chromosome partitioning ATPase
VSKIYEALRQREQATLPDDQWQLGSIAPGSESAIKRDMRALLRSIELAVPNTDAGPMLMFASAIAGEGKSTVCGNFAETLAGDLGKTVLILDGDQQHALARRFCGTAPGPSVFAESTAAVLRTSATTRLRGAIAVATITSGMGVLGSEAPDIELLATKKTEVCRAFDYVLIDAPSIADASWATALGHAADGVILVVEAEHTRWPVSLNAKQEFEASGAKMLGVFLNRRRLYIPPAVYRHL